MTAPDVHVQMSTGERRCLRDFYAERPLALLFLRHFGCIFCRQMVAQVRSKPNMNVVFVGLGTPEEATAFAEEFRVEAPIVCDPDRELYRKFDLSDGNLYQILGPQVMLRAVAALRQGHMNIRPKQPPGQLAGAFVIQPGGQVSWEYRATNAGDNPSVATIEAKLRIESKI